MIKIPFEKFHIAGNNFVIIDNLDGKHDNYMDIEEWKVEISRRHFGVEADSIIVLNKHKKYLYTLVVYGVKG